MEPATPTALGVLNQRYELREVLAEGGMGKAYRAFDRTRGRELVLKVLDGDHPLAPARLHRFKTELRRTPGVLPQEGLYEAYDLGLEEHGLLFLTLECLPSSFNQGPLAAGKGGTGSLAGLAGGGALGAEAVAKLATSAADALAGQAPWETVVEQLAKASGAERVVVQPEGGTEAYVHGGGLPQLLEAARLPFERVRHLKVADQQQEGGRASWAQALGSVEAPLALAWAEGPATRFQPEAFEAALAILGVMFQQDQRRREAQDGVRRLEMLNDLAIAVGSTLELQRILDLVLAQALEVSEAEQGGVYWGSEIMAARDRHGVALGADQLRVSQSVLKQVFEEGKAVMVLDTQEDQRFAQAASIMDLQLRSVMGVPLRAGEATRGVLYVSSRTATKAFGPDDLATLEAIAGQAALSLGNAEAYLTIQDLNQSLEAKVKARTRELSEALDELKATQAQLVQAEKMAGLGQMVAGVAHELNNPLNFAFGNTKVLRDYGKALLGLAELAQSKLGGDADWQDAAEEAELAYLHKDQPAAIEASLKGLERAQRIVADLKAFAAHDEAERKPVALDEALRSCVAMLRGRFGQVVFDEALPSLPPLEAEGKQLNQAFLAVLTNAAQACPAEGGRVCIALSEAEGELVVSVQDFGVGIPEEQLAKVFDPFFTTRPIGEGTGLGLTVAYSVAEQHGGSLQLASTLGEGTTATFRLPRRA